MIYGAKIIKFCCKAALKKSVQCGFRSVQCVKLINYENSSNQLGR